MTDGLRKPRVPSQHALALRDAVQARPQLLSHVGTSAWELGGEVRSREDLQPTGEAAGSVRNHV